MDTIQDDDWDERVARIWSEVGTLTDDELVRRIEAIVAERPDDDAAAMYERGSVYDSVGRESDAEPLYRQALGAGLDERRHPQAIIQLASTIRNLGKLEESVQLLTELCDAGPNAVTGDAGTAFLALALIDLGREREAALRLLRVLTPHLPRYHRSMHAYIDDLEARTGNDS